MKINKEKIKVFIFFVVFAWMNYLAYSQTIEEHKRADEAIERLKKCEYMFIP